MSHCHLKQESEWKGQPDATAWATSVLHDRGVGLGDANIATLLLREPRNAGLEGRVGNGVQRGPRIARRDTGSQPRPHRHLHTCRAPAGTSGHTPHNSDPRSLRCPQDPQVHRETRATWESC